MTGLYATLFSLYTVTKERLTNEERGATAVEYGLMVGLIGVAIIAAVILLGTKLSGLFSAVSSKMPAGS